jgi:hypothetical protein
VLCRRTVQDELERQNQGCRRNSTERYEVLTYSLASRSGNKKVDIKDVIEVESIHFILECSRGS